MLPDRTCVTVPPSPAAALRQAPVAERPIALPPVRRRARHGSKPRRIPRIRARVSAPGRRDPIGTAPASVDRDGQDVVSGSARGGTPVRAAGCSPQIDTAEGSIGSASFARTPWPALSRRGASCRAAASCSSDLLQPADRGGIHVVGAGNGRLRLALLEALPCLLPLVRRQLARPAELHTPGLGAGAAVTGARADQPPFELRQTAENRQHQPAVPTAGVRPGLRQAAEAG